MGYRHVAAGLHPDFTIDTHTLVGGTRVPVHKPDIRISRLGTEHLDSQHVLFVNIFGYIKLKLPERPSHLLTVGNLLSVEPHIRPITDAVEREQHMFAFL